MIAVALGMGVLLALLGCTATESCVASQDKVTQLLQHMEGSVNYSEPPNPSILLAMNLAGGNTEGFTYKWLLQEIKEEAVRKAQKDMTSGQVALYVLALLSSCEDPRQVQAQGQTLDLISVLQQKTDEEIAKLEDQGVPKTTLFSVSLDILALCLAKASDYQNPSVILAKQVLRPESHIFVDTRAVAVLALACAYDYVDAQDEQNLLQMALEAVTNSFLDEQEAENGMIGNIYSMGLALQALEATRKFYAPREWNCTQAFAVVSRHDYQQPMAIAQVLPALVGRSYLDAAGLDCSASPGPQVTLAQTPGVHTDFPPAPITVTYTITNKLQGKHFKHSTSVTVPDGSILLRVLEVAAAEKPQTFSFETEKTSWGPMVVSIHGLAGSTEDRTYWQFLSAGNALDEGVGTYKPHAGEHIQANFTTY